VLHGTDSLSRIEYYKEGERIFHKLRAKEDSILDSRYDRLFFDHLFSQFPNIGISDSSDLSYLSNRAYVSYLSHILYVSNMMDSLNRDYVSDRGYLSLLSYQSYRTNPVVLFYLSYQNYRSYILDPNLRSYSDYIYDYYDYYQNKQRDTFLYDDLNISQTTANASIEDDERTFPFPNAPYRLEDMIRSVTHAKQYWQKKIVFRYWKSFLLQLPLILALFFAIPYLNYRHSLLSIILTLIYIFTLISLVVNNQYLYFTIPSFGLLGFLGFSFFGKNNQIASIFFHCLAASMLGVLLVIFAHDSDSPRNLAFFSVSAMGLIAVILRAYVDKLPKGR